MRTRQACCRRPSGVHTPILGITGTGGAGKSSLTDELILRLRLDQDDRLRVAIISIDPSRKRTGGALLGDRIRMNAIDSDNIFMRSLATRDTGTELSAALPEVLASCKLSGFDLIVVETSGIGQGESAIVPLVDTLALCHDAGVRQPAGLLPFTAGVFPSSARARTRPGCSPARATPSAPTGASTCCPRASRPPGCRPPSTRSRSTASTRTCGPTSTARSATPACRSPPSTT
jgi:hypothetical protein